VAETREKARSDFIYVCVGTPGRDDGSVDLRYVEQAAIDIGRSFRSTDRSPVVVVKSTVLPGTTRRFVGPLLEKASDKIVGKQFGLCSNPEFLREGNAVVDSEHPDRIVIGSDDQESGTKLERLYKEFYGAQMPVVIRTSFENAELIKYASNFFLATKIGCINTMANIAERIPSADVTTVAQGIGLDPRIGSRFLDAGLGYGGSCFPKNVRALLAFSRSVGYDPELLVATIQVNRNQPIKAIEFAKHKLGSVAGKKIAVLGLAFKPNSDDMRDAVSIPIIEALLRDGAAVSACDPAATKVAQSIFGKRISYSVEPRECLRNADLAIVVTEWEEFRAIAPDEFVALMKSPIVYDGRRIYDPNEMRRSGIAYDAIGLGNL